MMPGRHHHTVPIDSDWPRYRECNIVECGTGWLKPDRRLATHFEQTASSYLGLVMFVAVRYPLYR